MSNTAKEDKKKNKGIKLVEKIEEDVENQKTTIIATDTFGHASEVDISDTVIAKINDIDSLKKISGVSPEAAQEEEQQFYVSNSRTKTLVQSMRSIQEILNKAEKDLQEAIDAENIVIPEVVEPVKQKLVVRILNSIINALTSLRNKLS